MEQIEITLGDREQTEAFARRIVESAKETGLSKDCGALIENGVRLMMPFFTLSGGKAVIKTDGTGMVIRFLGKLDRLKIRELSLLFSGGTLAAPAEGLLKTLWNRLGLVIRDGGLEKEPKLSDGVMHFGILANTGYYWSLADSENRRQYHDDKSTDRLKDAVLSKEEQELSDLRILYDNGELELELHWKL